MIPKSKQNAKQIKSASKPRRAVKENKTGTINNNNAVIIPAVDFESSKTGCLTKGQTKSKTKHCETGTDKFNEFDQQVTSKVGHLDKVFVHVSADPFWMITKMMWWRCTPRKMSLIRTIMMT